MVDCPINSLFPVPSRLTNEVIQIKLIHDFDITTLALLRIHKSSSCVEIESDHASRGFTRIIEETRTYWDSLMEDVVELRFHGDWDPVIFQKLNHKH